MRVNPWLVSLGPLLAVAIMPPACAEKEQNRQGYLVDRSCRASIEGDSNTLNFVRAQTKECILMPSCKQAGYAILTKGQWSNPDKKGNALAENYQLTTTKAKAFYVQAGGTAKTGTIRTKTIVVPEPRVEKE
jgi:hypothetical protein